MSHARSKSCSQSAGYDREMQQLLAGLWHWQAPHPDWAPTAHWPQQVSSYAVDDGTTLLLFDPLAVPQPLLELARVRIPVIVLTAPWHERDTQTLLGMLRCPVFTPSPDTAEDLVRKYGITLQQAGSGSPDLAWLLSGPSPGGEAHFYAAGDRLALGIDVFPGRVRNDVVLWLDSLRVVIAGDTLSAMAWRSHQTRSPRSGHQSRSSRVFAHSSNGRLNMSCPPTGCRLTAARSIACWAEACHIGEMGTALHAPVGAVLEGGYDPASARCRVTPPHLRRSGLGDEHRVASLQHV